MKRTMFTLCFAMFSLSYLFAQDNIVLENFESGTVGFTTTVNINPVGSMVATIVDNPFKTAANPSNKVWKFERVDQGTNNQIWAGFWATLVTEIPAGYKQVEVKYLRTNSTSQLKLKVEGSVTKEIDPVTMATATNTWETLVFDLDVNGIQNIQKFDLFPDYYTPIAAGSVTYVDDFVVSKWPTAVKPSLADKNILVYYSNGEIRVSNYVGKVSIFDLVGRKLFEGDLLEGRLQVNLDKGIYILSTREGNTKISIQ
ncbi:MAG TPA: hypothetical protein VGK10_19320 [Prolixibacteraceae bacterium]|jgi:hypothetical protein